MFIPYAERGAEGRTRSLVRRNDGSRALPLDPAAVPADPVRHVNPVPTPRRFAGALSPCSGPGPRVPAPGVRWLSLAFASFAASATLLAQPASEETPADLPGAEAYVFRDGGSGFTPPLRLFVVKPAGWKRGDRRPGLMFFFGGGWTTGTPAKSIFWAQFAASRGMVGIAPDYRTKGRHDVAPMASVADARAALRWVQDHADELGVDPARIAVGGNSAGGHVALWTAIGHAPPGSDERESPQAPPAALILFSAVSDTSAATGYTPQRFGELATALSPLHQLDPRMPPVLAFHGDADKTVPLRQALALRDKLLASGNTCELHVVPGGGHNFGNDVPEWREKSRELMIAFLRRHGLVD